MKINKKINTLQFPLKKVKKKIIKKLLDKLGVFKEIEWCDFALNGKPCLAKLNRELKLLLITLQIPI